MSNSSKMRTSLPRGGLSRQETRRRLAIRFYGPIPPSGPSGPQRVIYGPHDRERLRFPLPVEGRMFTWYMEPRCSVCQSGLADAIDDAILLADRLLAYRALAKLLHVPRSQRPKARELGWKAIAGRFPDSGLSAHAIRRHVLRGHTQALQARDWYDEVRRPQELARMLGTPAVASPARTS